MMECSPAKVCERVSKDQREAICAKFCAANPHWKGANFDDILDALDNGDANLSEVESAWEAHPDLRCAGFGTAVRALVWGGREISRENLCQLLGAQKVNGIGRIADNPRALLLGLAATPTDDEIRSLHEYLRGWHIAGAA